ncbi:methyltransferase domain-containing protein [Pseudomonas lopnurensis]|uniref:methyltransferase domain-containing protein n=1 Tax=Pseudomonas lopnurensis TaxID=1477517 RepID=UPI0028A9844F|nr:methyltransferase domain-containing protein [Pseudomonas lopnurensis]
MSTQQCAACGSIDTTARAITCTAPGSSQGKTFEFIFCNSCRFVSNPSNGHDFREDGAFRAGTNLPETSMRVGDGTRPGREFRMAEMGVDILRRYQEDLRPDVMVFGPGMSRDHALMKERLLVSRMAVSDLSNFQSVLDFVPVTSRQAEFDLVIASEVVEHFTDLQEDFSNLLFKVRETGLLIACTNMHDGVPLEGLAYPFDVGHTSYYSGQSLQAICERLSSGIRLDFRTPAVAFRGAGPRKRYIFFYRDAELGQCIAQYFADHHVAASE